MNYFGNNIRVVQRAIGERGIVENGEHLSEDCLSNCSAG